MSDLVKAQPPLEFIPPAFNPLVLSLGKVVLPWWLKLGTNITEVKAHNVETLARLYSDFEGGKIRLMMAFRHPNALDPLSMAYLMWKILPQVARENDISFKSSTHSHFIYDRGIPLWAGNWIGWLFSNLGGTSIQRGKLDIFGLKSARNLFANSNFPIAAAPEGATNGHNEIISPLEPGIAQMGFWCVEDLLKAGRSEEVFILPLGIQYSYVDSPWDSLAQLLTSLESDCGLKPEDKGNSLESKGDKLNIDSLYSRLYGLGVFVLCFMEDFYRNFYGKDIPKFEDKEVTNAVLADRLHNLLDVALEVAEDYFCLKSKGNASDRCRRLEQAGWDRIYRQELKQPITALERGLANLVAEEASLRMWHMRLVESFVAVTGSYVKEKPTLERFADTTLLLWDLITRIKGGDPSSRPSLGQQVVNLTVGEPISVSGRWDDYKSKRKSAISTLTGDIRSALEGMIVS